MQTQSNGKAALVTGGSRGIGAAIARRLGRDGFAVALTYAKSSDQAQGVVRAIEQEGGKALAIQADSGDPDAVKQAVAEASQSLGRLDVLVANAGFASLTPLEEAALEDFDRMFAVNVRGVFVAIQEAARRMKEGGRIITIGSINAERAPFPGIGVYAMTKAAIAGLVRGLARDLGPKGITINNVQPGPIDTDLNPDGGPFTEYVKPHVALGRYGKPEEVAGLVSYLAGPEAAYATGASFTVDGGFAA